MLQHSEPYKRVRGHSFDMTSFVLLEYSVDHQTGFGLKNAPLVLLLRFLYENNSPLHLHIWCSLDRGMYPWFVVLFWYRVSLVYSHHLGFGLYILGPDFWLMSFGLIVFSCMFCHVSDSKSISILVELEQSPSYPSCWSFCCFLQNPVYVEKDSWNRRLYFECNTRPSCGACVVLVEELDAIHNMWWNWICPYYHPETFSMDDVKGFSKSVKILNTLCRSVHCSMMFLRMNMWSV